MLTESLSHTCLVCSIYEVLVSFLFVCLFVCFLQPSVVITNLVIKYITDSLK